MHRCKSLKGMNSSQYRWKGSGDARQAGPQRCRRLHWVSGERTAAECSFKLEAMLLSCKIKAVCLIVKVFAVLPERQRRRHDRLARNGVNVYIGRAVSALQMSTL